MEPTTQAETIERERRLGSAFTDGRLAGQRSHGTGMNPYELGTEEYSEWLRGHQSATAQLLSIELAKRARTCRYRKAECDCGGRGFCLDVA